MPLLQPPIDPDAAATDDDLCELLGMIRRYVRDAPPGTWSPDVVIAARTLSIAISRLLADGDRGG